MKALLGFGKLSLVLVASSLAASAEQWSSLFDGETLAGWTRGKGQAVEEGKWVASEGVLTRKQDGAGPLFSEKSYTSFEFSFEWKISEEGNSGVKYRLAHLDGKWQGLEYQILDDDKHKAAERGPKALTAGLYDLKAADTKEVLKPAGEWNKGCIKVHQGVITHSLNGAEVMRIEIPSAEWQQCLDESKYRAVEGFGLAPEGRLMLQDHGNKVSFRNLKIREFKD